MSALYEIIELANGDIALQREGESSNAPLVTMRFSTELLRFMREAKIDIAKVMLEAGLEQVAEMAEAINPPEKQGPVEVVQEVQEVQEEPTPPIIEVENDGEPEELVLTPDAGSHLLH